MPFPPRDLSCSCKEDVARNHALVEKVDSVGAEKRRGENVKPNERTTGGVKNIKKRVATSTKNEREPVCLSH